MSNSTSFYPPSESQGMGVFATTSKHLHCLFYATCSLPAALFTRLPVLVHFLVKFGTAGQASHFCGKGT